jgi:ribonuclease R
MKPKNQTQTLIGVVKRHPDGFGFFIPDDMTHADVYIPKMAMRGVMTNDRVNVRVFREHGGQRFRGEVVDIVARSTVRVAGQFVSRSQSTGILFDKSLAWGEDLFVEKDPNLPANNGDWVSVAITRYPGDPGGFAGKIVAVIGDALDPLNDSLRVLHSSNIPFEFSKKALAEAERLPSEVTPADLQNRKDLRALKFVTIDGRTAKDFDDAVYVAQDGAGFCLWVAIADVSHYVQPHSAIDDDAYERGTSTYFPNFVAPMLPEKLSNHLCSLVPHVDRLAFVAEMKINFEGNIQSSKFYEAVICSHARVTYGEAQEVLDGNPVESLNHVAPEIRRASDLAKILMKKRFREGSLDLEIPESEIELDETGVPVDIIKSERLFSHRLIEELMLIANVAVAREFTRTETPSLYRVHDRPRAEDIQNLQKFMSLFGSEAKLSSGILQKSLTKSLQDFAGHPKAYVLHVLTLRSMAQAKYTPDNVGHFGLNFEDYAHFTSPIRRYPDLIVHRQLKAVLGLRGFAKRSLADLQTAGTFLSACEQRSVKAERKVQSIKKARFMRGFLGQEFEGVISSVAKFGAFVSLRQYDVDGLVRGEELFREDFQFVPDELRLVAKKSGLAYSIGDAIKVQVASVDIDSGQIDFILAGEKKDRKLERTTPPNPFKKSAAGRGKAANHRGDLRKTRVSKSRRKGKARSVSR